MQLVTIKYGFLYQIVSISTKYVIMFWRWLAVPLLIVALVFLYMTWEVDEKYAIYIVPPIVLIAVLYSLGPQIDWWWHRRNPPEIDPAIRQILNTRSAYYNNLSAEQKNRFRERMALFALATDFKPQAMETVPEDVKAAVSYHAVQLSLAYDEFLLEPFENVVLYAGPFPSPQYPQWHISETFEEDGVLLFSVPHLLKGFLQPAQYYPTGLHELAQAFIHKYPGKPWPEPGPQVWEDIRQISGVEKDRLLKYMGLPELPALPVCIAYFFTHPARFKAVRPDLYAAFSEIFQQDPAHA